jgi:hypothetical protein
MDVRMAWLTTCIPPKSHGHSRDQNTPLNSRRQALPRYWLRPEHTFCEKGLKVVKHHHLNLINLLGSEGDF